MTTLTNSFEGISSGTTVTTGNSGGASGTAFDTVTIVASGTDASDNAHAAHGSVACKIATAATSGTVFNAWSAAFGSGVSQVWFRQYLYFTANPGATIKPWTAFTGTAGSACAAVQVNTTGTLQMTDGNGTTITGTTTTNTIPLNQWFRIEGFVIGSATVGQVELKLFKTPDSATPDETVTSSALQNTRGTMGDWRYGENTSRANVVAYWMDDLGLSDAGYIGPVSFPGPASLGKPVHPKGRGLPPRGRVASNRGAAVRNPTSGPVFRQAVQPARARIPQRRKGGLVVSNQHTPPYVPPVPPPPPPPVAPAVDASPLPSLLTTFPGNL